MSKLLKIALIVVMAMASGQAFAKNGEFKKMNDAQLKRITSNKTFWKKNAFDRFYFESGGEFIQQLNSGWNNVPLGTMFTGRWDIKNSAVCWTYDNETSALYKTPSTPFCYAVFSDASSDTFMTLHSEKIKLYSVKNGQQSSSASFNWDRWASNNYILDPEFVPVLLSELKNIKEYRRQRNISDGTINRAELNDTMKNYYDEAIGKIFYVAGDHMYFGKGGQFFYTTDSKIKKAHDLSSLLGDDNFGTWSIKGNQHCFFRKGRSKPTCEFVAPKGKGLVRDYSGTLGFHNNGFSRIRGEMGVKHITPENSSSPELYKLVNEEFKKRAANR
ncbi:MAG: hypothetical protein COB76_06480 [Alphaproteobacteria bacterium]|nr:MAG: hypothetical protein COB76_06480 [Alphaproteobacteria bacterium]